MEKIREYLKNPLYTAIAAFVIGLLLGWVVLGWGLFPVQWVNASPTNLRPDLQKDYLAMAIQSFAKSPDPLAAQQRWQELGSGANKFLDEIRQEGNLPVTDIDAYSAIVSQGVIPTVSGKAPTETAQPGETPTQAAVKQAGKSNLPLLLGVLCVLLLVVAGALVYLLILRKPKSAGSEQIPPPTAKATEASRQTAQADTTSQVQEPPISQFVTTYMVGDDLYDDSFSIDSPSGEFLGECGVGISETIGVGDPKKVTAFEVWLFDKNDIQTITKVLMSTHAFNDPAIRQRLESKGEPVLAEPGERILLETATLKLEAKVVDMVYGQGAAPDTSFFERLTLELAVWPKAASTPA
jgi:hypothetical protein